MTGCVESCLRLNAKAFDRNLLPACGDQLHVANAPFAVVAVDSTFDPCVRTVGTGLDCQLVLRSGRARPDDACHRARGS